MRNLHTTHCKGNKNLCTFAFVNPNTDPHRLTALYHTLGCKLNFAETSTIGRELRLAGVQRALPEETPDICIINTCSVTGMADKKCRSLIRSLARSYPEAAIVVTGCYAQLNPEEAASLPGVSIVLGSGEKARAAEFIKSWIESRQKIIRVTPQNNIRDFRPVCEKGERTRWWLKVQDGCDYFCSYCAIPYARGRSRSASVSETLEVARQAAAEGAKEIIITGVNTGDFGRTSGESFFDLIRTLDSDPAMQGVKRFRISSIEPNLLTEEIVRWIASESRAFMPHFHIPLQAGSDKVLKTMGRRYDTSLFLSRIEMIRDFIPDAFIGVDIIAGAHGETPEEFERGKEFISSLSVSRLHVFPYSERPGTRAVSMTDSVDPAERHRRAAVLSSISDEMYCHFAGSMLGSVREVLWEYSHENEFHGFTDNYLRVSIPAQSDMTNTISPVRLIDIDGDLIKAEFVDV